MTQTAAHPKSALSESELSAVLALPSEPAQRARASFLPSPERIEQEMSAMTGRSISPEFGRWVTRYARAGKRNPYLWTWCRQAVELTTLPCVEAERRAELCDTKTLGVMLDVMWDDVADQQGDDGLLEELLGLVDGTSRREFWRFPDQQAYARFTARVWDEIQARVRRYPRYAEFESLLQFDYRQLCNVMRYSHLLNAHPELLNLTEHDVYTPHNMHIMLCSTFDLMCSPTFDRSEVGLLREMVWHGQWMGRIGNLVTTWQRELGEGDFTSGVYARAISSGDLCVEQLLQGRREEIEAAILEGGHEMHFLRRWRKHRQMLLARGRRLRSFDVDDYVAGFDRLICLHLGSRGRK